VLLVGVLTGHVDGTGGWFGCDCRSFSTDLATVRRDKDEAVSSGSNSEMHRACMSHKPPASNPPATVLRYAVLCYAMLCCAACLAEEWRHLAGMHADKGSVLALVLGAVVLAPLTEVIRHLPC
jgi:hypothetical protein